MDGVDDCSVWGFILLLGNYAPWKSFHDADLDIVERTLTRLANQTVGDTINVSKDRKFSPALHL